MSGYRFNPPPGWPPAPEGWTPPDGWQPDPSWPAPPPGWQLWLDDDVPGALSARGHNGWVTFDGRFVTITRSGYLAVTRVGRGEKRIAIEQITAVRWRSSVGLALGHIQFTVPGDLAIPMRLGRRSLNPNFAENAVTFYPWAQKPFEAIRAAVERRIQSPVQPVVAQPVADGLSELRQLGELRDAGILTPGEFEAQKALVLSRRR